MTQHNDPYTGEVFTPLRSNQKFANRRNQIAFNNAIARKNRRVKSPILSEYGIIEMGANHEQEIAFLCSLAR